MKKLFEFQVICLFSTAVFRYIARLLRWIDAITTLTSQYDSLDRICNTSFYKNLIWLPFLHIWLLTAETAQLYFNSKTVLTNCRNKICVVIGLTLWNYFNRLLIYDTIVFNASNVKYQEHLFFSFLGFCSKPFTKTI